MQHTIPIEEIGPLGEPMSQAIQKCVHCGFCLPVCPTYQVHGEEMDSPRGRIFLMKEVLEGRVDLDESTPYIDRCLGCVGCITACPSGVEYGDLITSFRAKAEGERKRSLLDRILRTFILKTLPHPGRFRWALRFGKIGKAFKGLMPGRMKEMLNLLPSSVPSFQALPELFPAEGERRARVALLAGCAQQVLAPNINWATLRVLAKNGVEVVIPQSQGCCGALAAHTGAMKQAQESAKQNINAFPQDVDAILTNAAGCGSGMHEYGLWLRGLPEQSAADEFVSKVTDVSKFLSTLGLCETPRFDTPQRVAYHDACHLAHAQGVRSEPRELLKAVENLELVEIPNSEMCCGSAGTYNIEQPETAAELGEQKASAIATTKPNIVATGNIGCMTQIETHLRQQHPAIRVMHTMEVLDACYRKVD